MYSMYGMYGISSSHLNVVTPPKKATPGISKYTKLHRTAT